MDTFINCSILFGVCPALLRQSVYGTIKFGTYYGLKHLLDIKNKNEEKKESLLNNVCCAVTAGVFSSAVANPTDVLKVRLQIQGFQHSRRSIIRSFSDIYVEEGIKGLWKGVGPTMQRAGTIAAVELPLYDYVKSRLIVTMGDNISNHFISSLIAGIGGSVASTPIDVLRTRIMNQKCFLKQSMVANSSLYKGTLDCLIKTVKHEGTTALYKGFIPTMIRMTMWNVIFFITYEQLKLIK